MRVHKIQGSESPAVVNPALTQHFAMLQRNLLHTRVTLGRRLLVLVGQEKAVAIAASNRTGRRRRMQLRERLPGSSWLFASQEAIERGHSVLSRVSRFAKVLLQKSERFS